MRYLLDTNVVLRFLLADDPKQSPQARALFAWAETEGPALRFPGAALSAKKSPAGCEASSFIPG